MFSKRFMSGLKEVGGWVGLGPAAAEPRGVWEVTQGIQGAQRRHRGSGRTQGWHRGSGLSQELQEGTGAPGGPGWHEAG